jgi:acyl-[acyl-carrier-protein]-phospholipid O-acyltransferase/long-chain-fatty-acid--[acyl-carrier-protein] ligase
MTHNGFRDLLRNGGFRAFLWTQFLGAYNDQIYQSIVMLYAFYAHGGAYKHLIPLVPAVFNLPFLLLSGYAGHLSDRIAKRTVLRGVKVFEILITAVGLAALTLDRFDLMLVVVLLLGVHSTVFGPAKYGIVPEILPDKDLSRGNALLEMSTFVGIVLGIVTGAFLYRLWAGGPWKMGLATMAVAVAGVLVSRGITRTPAARSTAAFRRNPFAEIGASTRRLLNDRPLWLAVLGVSYFWFVGVVMRLNLEYFGADTLKLTTDGIAGLWCCLALGIGVGNILAGRWSGDKVELGLVPFGSALMGIFGIGLFFARGSVGFSAACAGLLAVASGLFVVPLFAYIQQKSGSKEKGRMVAASNFYQTLAMLAASLAISLLHDVLHVPPAGIMLLLGIATLLVTWYALTLLPEFFVRFVLWLATHTFFRIRIVGPEHVPYDGPAVVVANHMSHVDGFLIAACLQRFIRFLVWRPYYEKRALNGFFRLAKAIPVGGGTRRDLASIAVARQALAEGELVGVFAEGAVSRTSNMLPFKRGMERIVDGLDVPVIPVHIDRMWGSIFSFERGKFFWKWPKRVPYPVTVSFGAPMPSTSTAFQVRQALQELASEAWERRKSGRDLLDRRFIRTARRQWGRLAMSDSTGRELTFGRLLAGAILASKWVRQHEPEGQAVGVMLPATVAGALVNVGITLAGRIPVNLNFTAGSEAIGSAMEQCGMRTILTSRAFLEKGKIEAREGMVFVEDILGCFGNLARLRALVAARLAPAALLAAWGRTPDSTAVIVFTSGSAGAPKGVMLSHHGVITNIDAMAQVYGITERDCIAGVLPFFHAFGFTATLWFPIVTGCGVAYHPNPAEAQAVGKLVEKRRATLLISTPTFFAAYARKCPREQFSSLRFPIAGGEKLRESVAAFVQEKLGLALLEGYGCTEMSPTIAVSVPDYLAGKDSQKGSKPGSVGHPLPGVAAQVVDPETLTPLAVNQEGLLLVKGPGRMIGYLRQPERTAEAFHQGWYITGDVALIDAEGFIHITDRLSRFSKIGGEMVPHGRVEEFIAEVAGACPCVVTALEDERRGERLAALYVSGEIDPAELWQRLAGTSLPRLWLPKRENLYRVEALPELATGKLDLRAVRERARELACGAASQAAASRLVSTLGNGSGTRLDTSIESAG